MQYEMIGHLCYMKTLANEMPRSDNVLFVFYDFETTQDTRFANLVREHDPNLVCVQHFFHSARPALIQKFVSVVERENTLSSRTPWVTF